MGNGNGTVGLDEWRPENVIPMNGGERHGLDGIIGRAGDGVGEQIKTGKGRPGGGKNAVRTKSGFHPSRTSQGG